MLHKRKGFALIKIVMLNIQKMMYYLFTLWQGNILNLHNKFLNNHINLNSYQNAKIVTNHIIMSISNKLEDKFFVKDAYNKLKTNKTTFKDATSQTVPNGVQ